MRRGPTTGASRRALRFAAVRSQRQNPKAWTRGAALLGIVYLLGCGGGEAPAPAAGARALAGESEAATGLSGIDGARGESGFPSADDAPVVAFLGDSLTAGFGLAEAQAYPAVVGELLRARGVAVRVVNGGVSGDTSAGALARVDWLLTQEPDVLVVSIGGNDGLRGQPVAALEANVREIVRRARASGAEVLLTGQQIPTNYGPDYATAFRELYPRVAREEGAQLLPFLLEGVAMRPELESAGRDPSQPRGAAHRRRPRRRRARADAASRSRHERRRGGAPVTAGIPPGATLRSGLLKMMKCRSCGAEMAAGAVTCRVCGKSVAAGRRAGLRLLPTMGLGVVLGLVVVGVYWWIAIRPRVERILDPWVDAAPSEASAEIASLDSSALFDVAVELPGNPLGAVWTGKRILIGNREDPWGLMIVEPRREKRWRVTKQPIVEPGYHQRISLDTLTWNGREIVAVTDGSWFEKPGAVFVTIDPESYRIRKIVAAPERLGCLAWDGVAYWGASRRNTEDEALPSFLYRFDGRFEELARYDPPGVGCQGLVWDGRRLWFADVFDDALTLLDLTSGSPTWSGGDRFEIEYLSGVAWDGESIWITEYGDKRLHRLNPILQRAWTRDPGRPEAAP